MIPNPAYAPEAWQTVTPHIAALGESPFWHPNEQMLYWVDISGRQILRANIYMGTVGMRGAYKAMRTGYVSEAWAKEHHVLWYDDVQAGKIPRQRSASQPAAAAAATLSAGQRAQV